VLLAFGWRAIGGDWWKCLEGLEHLDLGGEVLHDGADELGFVGGEGGGGVGAGSGGVVSVFHGGSVSDGNGFWFLACM
jgi:hypothetical protein